MVPFEAERAVLAIVFSQNDPHNQLFSEVSERLDPHHFESDAHRLIYKAMLGIVDLGQEVNLLNVFRLLLARRHSTQAGGLTYLFWLLGTPEEVLVLERCIAVLERTPKTPIP